MAEVRSKAALDTLQAVFNDVLVQTGKALRASSQTDSQGNTVRNNASINPRLPETVRTFHSALDDLESEIKNAKSVLLRDLNALRSRNAVAEQTQQSTDAPSAINPEPVQAQTKSPMVMDIDSSPTAADQNDVKPAIASSANQALNSNNAAQGNDGKVKAEPVNSTPNDLSKAGLGDFQGQDLKGAANLPESELNFTNMEFSLAPGNNDSAQPGSMQDSNFDLTNFAPADDGDDLLSLLPSSADDTVAPATSEIQIAQPDNPTEEKTEEKKDNAPNSDFNNVFNFDDGDGMDFDFSLDGGGGDTFNDLMDDRDGTIDLTGPDDFDSFFDKTDGS